MRYQFSHPEEKDVFFRYDSELPMWIERHHCGETQRLPLRHKNINAEEFFLCLITAKVVHYEDRFEGFAFLGERKCPISKPADCKWVIHKVLNISKKRPLIQTDRQEKRYLWPLTDKEMRIPEEPNESAVATPPPVDKPEQPVQSSAFETKRRTHQFNFDQAQARIAEELAATAEDMQAVTASQSDFQESMAAKTEEFRQRQAALHQRFQTAAEHEDGFPLGPQADQLRDKIAEMRKRFRGES